MKKWAYPWALIQIGKNEKKKTKKNENEMEIFKYV